MTHKMHLSWPRSVAVYAVLLSFAAALGAQKQSTPAQTAQSAEWKSYSYPADGFSATFPAEPSMQKKNVPTDAGTFELRAYLAQDGEAAIFVGVCDYGAAVANRDPDTVLDGAQQGAIDNVSAHLVSGKKTTFGIYHGRVFEAENDSMHFSARIYLVGTTLYQTLTAAPLGPLYSGSTRFLDSFQLIARVPK
jgi:hypothetical protein